MTRPTEVERLAALLPSGLTPEEYRSLAMLSLDRAGMSLKGQCRVSEIIHREVLRLEALADPPIVKEPRIVARPLGARFRSVGMDDDV